jgi:hypothetical protein
MAEKLPLSGPGVSAPGPLRVGAYLGSKEKRCSPSKREEWLKVLPFVRALQAASQASASSSLAAKIITITLV